MREKISVYVDELFSDAALTIRNAEVQQEILQHTLDRYDDLIAAGKSEQEAYDEAVSGIGDVSELYEHKQAAEKRRKRGIFLRRLHPDAVSTAPQTGRKKKLPGWAIALICVGVAAAILALNFAGQAAFGVLRAGGRYIYDNANKYETLDRSGFGSAEDSVAASELLTGIDRDRDPLADRRCVSGRIERGRRGFSGGLYRRQ
ncbi:MAG: permease prefix domain 1-containing protein [Oscillospiraceae bacterium]